MSDKPLDAAQPDGRLSLFDSVCIIVGIIIGAGIYETAPQVVAGAPGAPGTPGTPGNGVPGVVGLWLMGGLLSLCGAMCWAELATAWPRDGGDYHFLSRAYGRWAGFSFAWARIWIIQPTDIALMAFAFGRYFGRLTGSDRTLLYAASAVAALTTIQLIGLRSGKWTQNLLTVIKVAALLAILVLAVFAPAVPASSPSPIEPATFGGFELALILVMFTYGGWNEMAYVAAEVKRPERNIARALVLGTAGVTLLYVLVNLAFIAVLGRAGVAASDAVAADFMAAVLPQWSGQVIAATVCISALGAANGLIFTGARVTYAVGAEHRPLRLLGRWNARRGIPPAALALQGTLALAVVIVGETFTNTIIYSSPIVWFFFLATTLALIVLRRREPDVSRPFRVIGYPFTPLAFAALCLFMIYTGLSYAWSQRLPGPLVAVAIVLLGLGFYRAFAAGQAMPDRASPRPQ